MLFTIPFLISYDLRIYVYIYIEDFDSIASIEEFLVHVQGF